MKPCHVRVCAALGLLMVVGLVAGVGCRNRADARRPALLTPQIMRVNPTFTRIEFPDDQTPFVEADVELRDEFGDATKAAGRLLFELYDYRADGPDIRGQQGGPVLEFDLSTAAAQKAHWQVIGTYRFRLTFGNLNPQATYVLAATYNRHPDEAGGRLFDRLVLTPRRPD